MQQPTSPHSPPIHTPYLMVLLIRSHISQQHRRLPLRLPVSFDLSHLQGGFQPPMHDHLLGLRETFKG